MSVCVCVYVCASVCVCFGLAVMERLPELFSGLHHHKVPGVVDPLVQDAVPLLMNDNNKDWSFRQVEQTLVLADNANSQLNN